MHRQEDDDQVMAVQMAKADANGLCTRACVRVCVRVFLLALWRCLCVRARACSPKYVGTRIPRAAHYPSLLPQLDGLDTITMHDIFCFVDVMEVCLLRCLQGNKSVLALKPLRVKRAAFSFRGHYSRTPKRREIPLGQSPCLRRVMAWPKPERRVSRMTHSKDNGRHGGCTPASMRTQHPQITSVPHTPSL